MTGGEPRRLARLRMRSWRRGTKEMDLVLGRFADTHLAAMSPETLESYEALLAEDDDALWRWITGREPPPAPLAPLVARIADGGRAD